MFWYVFTFFGGFCFGFIVAAILASAGCADRQIERMLDDRKRTQ